MAHNPKNFQVEIEGKAIAVTDLTGKQLQQELCKAIATIEKLDAIGDKHAQAIAAWRNAGKASPVSDAPVTMAF